jgi:predicted nucleotidyltransferase
MYTLQSNRPLNPITAAILKAVQAITVQSNASYFIIGATARDILMTHVFGIDADRATRDVDLAVALEDWSQFEAIKKAFIDSGNFMSLSSAVHRLYYQPDVHDTAYPLDLIPFGKITGDKNTIAWPPDMATVMNVSGYQEAFESAVQVEVGAGLTVKVVSIPALAALKLLAWNDRGLKDNKDAQDLLFLLKNYHVAGNAVRLYEEALPILESCGFAVDLAGATLLGYDSRMIIEDATRQLMLNILNDPIKRDRLSIHMSRALQDDANVSAGFIDQFQRGLLLPKL